MFIIFLDCICSPFSKYFFEEKKSNLQDRNFFAMWLFKEIVRNEDRFRVDTIIARKKKGCKIRCFGYLYQKREGRRSFCIRFRRPIKTFRNLYTCAPMCVWIRQRHHPSQGVCSTINVNFNVEMNKQGPHTVVCFIYFEKKRQS